jgi:hypothetical protein
MRLSRIAAVTCFGLLLCATTAAWADDQVDDPRYLAWAKFGVGSSQTLNGDMEAGQMKMTSVSVRKLVEKTDDHVTIEFSNTVTIMGQDRPSPPQKIVIHSKIDKSAYKQLDDEKVDAAGKTFDCKVYELPSASPDGQQSTGKCWINDEVPGGLVKMVVSTQRGTVTQTLASYDAK